MTLCCLFETASVTALEEIPATIAQSSARASLEGFVSDHLDVLHAVHAPTSRVSLADFHSVELGGCSTPCDLIALSWQDGVFQEVDCIVDGSFVDAPANYELVLGLGDVTVMAPAGQLLEVPNTTRQGLELEISHGEIVTPAGQSQDVQDSSSQDCELDAGHYGISGTVPATPLLEVPDTTSQECDFDADPFGTVGMEIAALSFEVSEVNSQECGGEVGFQNCSKDAGAEALGRDSGCESNLDDAQHVQQTVLAEETLLIFDWDDTVLPSTWIAGQQLRLDESCILTSAQREQLGELSRCAAETLRLAKLAGTVVLVTNAERGWIELSGHKFLPQIVPILESCKLVSARTAHESPQLPDPLDWKLEAFAREMVTSVVREDGEVEEVAAFTNVLSFGDGAHERQALIHISASVPECRGKSLRFVERPSIGKLCRQHRLVSKRLQQLVRYDGDLDLCMRRGKKSKRKRGADAAFGGEVDAAQQGRRPRLEGVQGFGAVSGLPMEAVSA